MNTHGIFIYCFILFGVGQLSYALYCEQNGFYNYDCPKGCCVNSAQPWTAPHCCEKSNTKLLLGQIITLGICIGLGIVIALMFAGCWIHERNKYKTKIQAGFVLVPSTTAQGNVAPFYPQSTPTTGLQMGAFASNLPYTAPHPSTSALPHRLPPISQPLPPEKMD